MIHGREPQSCPLPTEILEVISEKLTNIYDYIRFRCVCKSWRSSATFKESPPQLPLLMLPYDITSGTRSFRVLSSKRVYNVHLPESRGKQIIGSSYGWWILLHPEEPSYTVSLLNPVTRAQIHLPRVLERNIPSKAFLSSSPTGKSEDYIVMLIFTGCPNIAFCKPGYATTWSILNATLPNPAAVAYHRGKFYVKDEFRSATVVVDECSSSGLPILMPVPDLRMDYSEFRFLNSSEELLLVVTEWKEARIALITLIFKLDIGGDVPRWSRIGTVGDRALFLSGTSVISVRANGGLERDCVYSAGPRSLRDGIIEEADGDYCTIYSLRDGFRGRFLFLWKKAYREKLLRRELLAGNWFTPSFSFQPIH